MLLQLQLWEEPPLLRRSWRLSSRLPAGIRVASFDTTSALTEPESHADRALMEFLADSFDVTWAMWILFPASAIFQQNYTPSMVARAEHSAPLKVEYHLWQQSWQLATRKSSFPFQKTRKTVLSDVFLKIHSYGMIKITLKLKIHKVV